MDVSLKAGTCKILKKYLAKVHSNSIKPTGKTEIFSLWLVKKISQEHCQSCKEYLDLSSLEGRLLLIMLLQPFKTKEEITTYSVVMSL